MDQDKQALMDTVERLGDVSAEGARKIVNGIYQDGIVDRDEAEKLFEINAKMAGTDVHWDQRFVEAIKDYLLETEAPKSFVTEEECDWLIEQVLDDGVVSMGNEMDLILSVLRHSESCPPKLGKFACTAIADRIKAAGKATKDEVERMRSALYAPSGDGSLWVTRWEATLLFKTNDAVAFAKNDPSWNDLFARCIANHLMARAHPAPATEEASLAREAWLSDTSSSAGGFMARMAGAFGQQGWFETVTSDPKKASRARLAAKEAADREAEQVDAEETGWFLKRLGWDKKVSPAERALIDFLKAEAPGFTAGIAEAA